MGDEALLAIIVARLRARFPYVEIEVLSEAPELTAHELRVDATPRGDLGAIRRAINRADIVLSGGGGLLQDATSLRSLVYYAGIIRSAIKAHKATAIFSQSIGPLEAPGRLIVKECCKGLAAATVRDQRSVELLQPLLSIPVTRTADPVFLYEEEPPPPGLEWLDAGDQPLVVVCVRKAPKFDAAALQIAAAVDRLSEQYGARVAFLPIGGTGDAEASTIVIRRCRTRPMLVGGGETLAITAAVLRRACAVIGMRLHALILAVRFGVPFLAVSYDPKVTSLCEDIAYPLPALWTSPNQRSKASAPRPAEALVDQLWEQRALLRTRLQAAGMEMRALAERNFDVVESLIDKGRK